MIRNMKQIYFTDCKRPFRFNTTKCLSLDHLSVQPVLELHTEYSIPKQNLLSYQNSTDDYGQIQTHWTF